MVTIHVITYNEEILIEFFINHYRKNFPNCIIKLYDNYSTDNTVNIAKKYGCEINYYDSNDKLSDSKFLEIKNHCWKNSTTDWVIVCDCDELININHIDLIKEQNNGTTIIKFDGYTLINYENDIQLKNIKYGFKDEIYSKSVLFNSKKIKEVNYSPGCHTCHPIGEVKWSLLNYKLLHYKFLNVNYTISRYKLFAERLSDENLQKRWSIHYIKTTEEIINLYETYKNKVHEVL